MKKILLSAIALFIGINFASAQSYGPNIIVKGDFELQWFPLLGNPMPTGDLPAYLWHRSSGQVVKDSVVTGYPISGIKSVRINTSSSNEGLIRQRVSVEQNTVYRVTVSGRVQDAAGPSGSTSTNKTLLTYVRGGASWGTTDLNTGNITSGTNSTITYEVNTGAFSDIIIQIAMWKGVTAYGYVDDIKIEKKLATITTSVNDETMGVVTPTGTVNWGPSTSVTATPNSGYQFDNWTETGNVVSTNATYTFPANGDRTLVANFSKITTSIDQSKSATKAYAVGHNVFVEGGQMVEVYNLAGNLVKREQLTNNSFEIEQKGAYLLRIQSANGVSNHKIVIQ